MIFFFVSLLTHLKLNVERRFNIYNINFLCIDDITFLSSKNLCLRQIRLPTMILNVIANDKILKRVVERTCDLNFFV